MIPLYEDNHIIIVNKRAGKLTQGDKTGDKTIADEIKMYIKERYAKSGSVFLGIPHRLDRPTSGIVVLARTSKALSRLNKMFHDGDIQKTYWAIVEHSPEKEEETLIHWLVRNEKQNKSYAYKKEVPNSRKAILDYRVLAHSDRYTLLEIQLHTGRHHQIRCQLAAIGCKIKGDLKYGALRSNPDGSISLHARKIQFIHPVSQQSIAVTAPVPDDKLWQFFQTLIENQRNK